LAVSGLHHGGAGADGGRDTSATLGAPDEDVCEDESGEKEEGAKDGDKSDLRKRCEQDLTSREPVD
jgi:hypothetical protein